MKPSPVPLFNYRKRERYALVSDPQKNSKPNVSGGDGIVNAPTVPSNKTAASSFANTDKLNESNFKYSTDATNNSKSSSFTTFNNRNSTSQSVSASTWNMPNNKPIFSSKIKPPLSLPKVPALMSHKTGVSNRRVDSGNGSSDRGGKVNVSNWMNQNVPTKLPKPGSNTMGSQRGRGRGGRQSGGIGDGTRGRGNKDGHNSARGGWNDNLYCHSSSSSSFPLSDHDFSSGYMSGCSSSSSTDPWQNTPSAPNTWKPQSSHGQNKSKSLKLQSGNVSTHFGRTDNNQSKDSTSHMHSTFNQGRDYSSSGQATAMNTPFSIFDEEDVVQFPKDQKPSFNPLDTSLRIFTCPIKDLQSWSEAGLYEEPVLFEVYGLIISGPTIINSGLGKEFYVRDQSATMRCIFYEIDRELPSMMKGQVHRIIGSFDKRQTGGGGSGYLKVVSIRWADKEERQTCQDATEISLNEMDRLARQLDKEQ